MDASTSRLPRLLPLVLAVALGFLAVVHLPFAIWNAYGSDDAAWDGIAIMLWAQHDRLPTETGTFVEERFRSSPLPAFLIKRMLDARFVPFPRVPIVMNAAALLAGLLVPGLLYLLWRQLASAAEAAMAVALLVVSPEFFSLKLDGLPTLPALALLLVSLLAFVSTMRCASWRWAWLLLAACAFILAVLTKVDVILLSPALLVVALMAPREGRRWKYVALSLALPLVSLVVWHLFCTVVAPDAPQTAESFQRWSQRWGITPAGLLDRDNLQAMLMAPGVGTVLALIPAVGYCLASRENRWFAAAAVACILPTILFWGLRELNSSRHTFWIVIPVALLIAAAVRRAIRDAKWQALLVAAICAGNYFLGPGPAQETYRQATSHFLSAAVARKVRVEKEHADYELLLRSRGQIRKICIWDVGAARARAIATFVAHADRCQVRVVGKSHNDWHLEARLGDEAISIWLPDASDLQTIWPEICCQEYDLFVPGDDTSPFFHVQGRPEAASATKPPRAERWP